MGIDYHRALNKDINSFWEETLLETVMSKYIYATVYEQFTGLKPPEPKSHKPRRRRGYGHPYRMRLNMQEHEEGIEEGTEREFSDDFETQPTCIPELSGNTSRPTIKARTNTYAPIESAPLIDDHPTSRLPKVTYKKRRHYGPSMNNEQAENFNF